MKFGTIWGDIRQANKPLLAFVVLIYFVFMMLTLGYGEGYEGVLSKTALAVMQSSEAYPYISQGVLPENLDEKTMDTLNDYLIRVIILIPFLLLCMFVLHVFAQTLAWNFYVNSQLSLSRFWSVFRKNIVLLILLAICLIPIFIWQLLEAIIGAVVSIDIIRTILLIIGQSLLGLLIILLVTLINYNAIKGQKMFVALSNVWEFGVVKFFHYLPGFLVASIFLFLFTWILSPVHLSMLSFGQVLFINLFVVLIPLVWFQQYVTVVVTRLSLHKK